MDQRHKDGSKKLSIALKKGQYAGFKTQNGEVTEVKDGSPAHTAKLRVGMRIEAVGGMEVESDKDIRKALKEVAGMVTLGVNTGPRPWCPKCGSKVMDSTEHLFRTCPAYIRHRTEIFGDPHPTLTILTTHPRACIKYLRCIDRWNTADWCPQTMVEADDQRNKAARDRAAAAGVPRV